MIIWAVVVRPFYREHPPYVLRVMAETEEQAHNRAIANHFVK